MVKLPRVYLGYLKTQTVTYTHRSKFERKERCQVIQFKYHKVNISLVFFVFIKYYNTIMTFEIKLIK